MTSPILPTLAQAGLLLASMTLSPAYAQMGTSDPQTVKLELSAGASRGPQSLFKGLLLHARNDPLIGVEAAQGRWFASSLNGVGYLLADSPSISVGLSANYMLGRKEANDARYRGMGDVSGTLAAYGFFEWRPVKDAVTVYGTLTRSARSSHGTVASLGATLGLPVTARLSAFADVYVSWADARYMQAFYGISAEQSLSSAYPLYLADRPRGGLLSSTPSVGLDYEWDAHWHVSGFVGRNRLASLAANSPMVQGRAQPVAALFVKYKF